MPRVPRVPGRSIKLNPLPDTTQKLNAPAAALGTELLTHAALTPGLPPMIA